MPAVALAALAGILVGLFVRVPVAAFWWPPLLTAGGGLLWWLGGRHSLIFATTFALAALHSHWYLDDILPAPLVRQDILVTAVVDDFPRVAARNVRLSLRVPDEPSYELPGRHIVVRQYGGDIQPKAGETWQLKLRLKEPRATVNRGAFDAELWNFRNRVHATGYIRDSPLNRNLAEAGPRSFWLRLRRDIREKLAAVRPSDPMLPLLSGIVIGARDSIDAATWDVLRDTGTSHLIAISGLHIGMIGVAAWWCGRLGAILLQLVHAPVDGLLAARVAALAAACGYALLAGLPVPTLRACIMVGIVIAGAWFGRARSAPATLGTAFVAVLIPDPLAVLAPGFWLSFGAVAILMFRFINIDAPLSSGYVARLGQTGAKMVSSQWALSLGMALPGIWIFGQVANLAPVANLLAVPWFSLAILPAALAGTLLAALDIGFGALLLGWSSAGLGWLLSCLRWLAGQSFAVWRTPGLALMQSALAAAGVAMLLMPRPAIVLRVTGMLVLLAALTWPQGHRRIAPGTVRITQLDVGQGLAVLIQTRTRDLLYDTGGKWPGGDAGSSVVVPALRARGVTRLDTVVISHGDADHSGGLGSVLEAFAIDRIIAPAGTALPGPQSSPCRAGEGWVHDGVAFRFLHPGAGERWSENNASCVLQVQARSAAALLTGDVEAAAEEQLAELPDLETTGIVFAPHHGSRTSSSKAFTTRFDSPVVLISAGYANRWGFPHPEVAERWLLQDGCLVNSATFGAVTYQSAADGRFHLHHADGRRFRRPWALRKPAAAPCD